MELMGGIDNKLYSKNIELLVLKDTLVVVVIVLDAQLCLILCDPMDCSMPDLCALHYLPELAQTHVH